MIRRITGKELDLLDSTITGYLKYMNEKHNRPKYPLKDRLDEGLKKKTIEIFGKFLDNEAIGFVVINLNFVGMNIFLDQYLIEEKKLSMAEIDLFNEGFSRMKKEFQSVKYMGPVSELLAQHLKKNDFMAFKRARMRINEDSITSLDDPTLPPGYKFREYRFEDKESLAEVMSLSHFNKNHPDGLIWGNWNGIDGCMDLLKGIESNHYGKFQPSLSEIIEKDGKPIAACLVTVLPNEFGYIPEIVVSQAEKGKGLGNMILVSTLKKFIKSGQYSSKIELDVTLDNSNASKLYSSLGFNEINQYSVYAWNETTIE